MRKRLSNMGVWACELHCSSHSWQLQHSLGQLSGMSLLVTAKTIFQALYKLRLRPLMAAHIAAHALVRAVLIWHKRAKAVLLRAHVLQQERLHIGRVCSLIALAHRRRWLPCLLCALTSAAGASALEAENFSALLLPHVELPVQGHVACK
jgi:hypothetical protein